MEGQEDIRDLDIDCVYVVLCRNAPIDMIKSMKESDLIRKTKGFELQALVRLFESPRYTKTNQTNIKVSNWSESEGDNNEMIEDKGGYNDLGTFS